MTYQNCKTLIAAGRYEYEQMFGYLDLFLLVGRINQDQYIELTGMMVPPEPEPLPEDPMEVKPIGGQTI